MQWWQSPEGGSVDFRSGDRARIASSPAPMDWNDRGTVGVFKRFKRFTSSGDYAVIMTEAM